MEREDQSAPDSDKSAGYGRGFGCTSVREPSQPSESCAGCVRAGPSEEITDEPGPEATTKPVEEAGGDVGGEEATTGDDAACDRLPLCPEDAVGIEVGVGVGVGVEEERVNRVAPTR